jgi:hypothetical protein
MGKTRTSQITHFLYSSSARRLRRRIGGDLQPRQHPAHLSLLFSYFTRSFLHLSFDTYVLYETTEICFSFFFLARGTVSSLCLVEINHTRKLENRRKTRKEAQMVKFRAETITSRRKEGKTTFSRQTNTTFLLPLSLSLSFVCVSLFIARNGTPSVETARCREQRHHRDEPATNSRRTSGASSSFFSFFLF